MSHTPGPWRVSRKELAEGISHYSVLGNVEKHLLICDLFSAHAVRGHDADLIAAAPDLLKAIKQAYNLLISAAERGDITAAEMVVLANIDAAIQKAEGSPE